MSTEQQIRLTSYSKGAGCGCKIAPGVLEEILQSKNHSIQNEKLVVGYATGDDAAVYYIGNNQGIISTTDFFMPIVDDAFDFGRIASANAISDVYAMGGKPLMAIAILGWPVDKLSPAIAQQVLDGARAICAQAGIPLAGGHSIDSAEPIFGLSVTGMIDIDKIKKNSTSKPGDYLFITKPVGVGILSTALKREVIEEEHLQEMLQYMTQLNSIGEQLGKIEGVTAMTDVTGFGLLGHCMEMAEGAWLSVEISYAKIPVVAGAREYLSKRIVPDATFRNWNNYSSRTAFATGVNVMEAFSLLPDPQTNGGLLFSVSESYLDEVKNLLKTNGYENFIEPIGVFTERKEKVITVGL